jgi:hypothetical protein
MLQLGLNQVTNSQYHADSEFLSSSGLKLILTDLPKFYQEKILKNVPPRIEKAYFSEGSLFHSMLLEPHRVKEEYAFFEGWRKAGADFERFKLENSDKIIISKPQQHRVESWVQSVNAKKIAMELLDGGEVEHTICTDLAGVKVKTRSDKINIEAGRIIDLKTTSDDTEVELFKHAAREYGYDLSAALYCMVAELHYGKPFEFYFVVASKADNGCAVYKMSRKSMLEGMTKVMKAIELYKTCVATNNWAPTELKAIKLGDEILEV